MYLSYLGPLIFHLNMQMCKSQENNILISKQYQKMAICQILKKPKLAFPFSPFIALPLFLLLFPTLWYNPSKAFFQLYSF